MICVQIIKKYTESLLFIAILFLFYGCKNITSQYSVKNFGNRKICIFSNIENNAQRAFIRRVKESPNVVDIDICDYLLLTDLQQIQGDILNNIGIRIESKITMNLTYALYKNDFSKINDIKSILNKPTLHVYDQYTSGKGASMSKGSGVAVNENKERNYEAQSSHNVYIGTKVRIGELLKQIGAGEDFEDSVYMVNNALLTSLQQSKEDVENQLAKTLAERVLDDVIFDIINFEKSEHVKKCREYYEEYIDINFDSKELRYFRKNISKEKEFEKSCIKEFLTFRKEKDKNIKNKQIKYSKKIQKEKNIRFKIFKSGKQKEIEEYSLQKKKDRDNKIKK